jgi:uncharacterized protein
MKPWNESKNKINQRRHKVSFEAAILVFNDPGHITIEDYEDENGELRHQTIGLAGVTLLFVAHVYRIIDGVETPWLINARKADDYEENLYSSHDR